MVPACVFAQAPEREDCILSSQFTKWCAENETITISDFESTGNEAFYFHGKIVVQDFEVSSNHTEIKSATQIRLEPGFQVNRGAAFQAFCGNANKQESQSPERDQTPELKVSIFPNPSVGQITVHIFDWLQMGNIKMEVFNLVGEKIYRSTITEAQQGTGTLDLSGQTPGQYFIKLSAPNQIVTVPFVLIP